MRAVPALGLARLRHRPARWLLVLLGVAAAAALPVVAQGTSTVVASNALAHGIAGLPVGARSLIVSYPGVVITPAELAAFDSRAKTALATLSSAPIRSQLLFRRIADTRGGTFSLGATDDLGTAVRLTGGRLPTSCTPSRCEVVQLGLGAPALDPALGIVIVGTAVRTDPLLLKGTFDPGNDAPLLLADGVGPAQQLASLEQFQRSYGWVTSLDLGRVNALGVDAYIQQSAAVSDALSAAASGTVLTAPDDVLRTEQSRALLSARRFALLGGSAVVLLLGFAVIGAIGLRRDHTAFIALLRRRGARPSTVRSLTLAQAVIPVGLGTVLGLALGAVAAAWLAQRAAVPVATAAGDAVVGALPSAAVTLAVASLVVFATLAWPAADPGTGSASAWRGVDTVIAASIAIVALALARGTVSAAELSGGTDPLLLALPILGVLAGGLLAARVWPWTAAALAGLLPSSWLPPRLALLGALRRPLRPVATVAFLTGATAVVVFTGAYRATLEQGALDQAVFAVPLDARVTTGNNLERPFDVADPVAYGQLTTGGSAYPVVRAGGAVRVTSFQAAPLDVVGVDPAALPLIRSWSHVAGGLAPDEAARMIADHPPIAATGIAIPSGATSVSFPVAGTADQLTLVVWLKDSTGRDLGVELKPTSGSFSAPLPGLLTGASARITSFTLTESADYATKHQHNIGEGTTTVAVLAGQISLGQPEFRTSSAAIDSPDSSWTGWGSASAAVTPSPAGVLHVDYQLAGNRLVVTSGFVADPAPLPALVDAETAARAIGGRLTLSITGGAALPVRVVGVLPRFPTASNTFAILDGAALAARLDSGQPGSGASTEVWVHATADETRALADALHAPPYDRLSIALQAEREEALRTDPVAQGASGLLLVGAALALVLAALSLVLLVLVERRDESAEFYAWETDGLAPATLRWVLFLRALSVAGLAVPAGVLLGLVLSRVTTALVTVTAVGSAPEPPLTVSLDARWIGAVLVLGFGVAVGTSAAVAWRALREAVPLRPEGDPR